MLHQNAIKIQAKGTQRFLVHFWSKEDEFHSKLVGNIEPVKPEKPEPQSPSPNNSHLTKPDKARARTFGKTESPSPNISGPDPTLVPTDDSSYLPVTFMNTLYHILPF